MCLQDILRTLPLVLVVLVEGVEGVEKLVALVEEAALDHHATYTCIPQRTT
jgi:hypothetical protein